MNVFETAVKYSHLGLRLDWISRDRFRFRGSVTRWADYLTADLEMDRANASPYSSLAIALDQSIEERRTWLRDDILAFPRAAWQFGDLEADK